MARRNDHTREEITRMAILAARSLLVQEGQSGLSARKIAKKIGYSAGTLYQVFDGIDMLVLHVNAVTLDALHHALKPALDKEDACFALAHLYVKFAEENPHLWSSAFTYTVPKNMVVPSWYRSRVTKLLELVEAVLTPYCEGDARANHARLLWSGMQGICSVAFGSHPDIISRANAQSMTEQFVATYLVGIAAQETG